MASVLKNLSSVIHWSTGRQNTEIPPNYTGSDGFLNAELMLGTGHIHCNQLSSLVTRRKSFIHYFRKKKKKASEARYFPNTNHEASILKLRLSSGRDSFHLTAPTSKPQRTRLVGKEAKEQNAAPTPTPTQYTEHAHERPFS